MSSQIHPYVKPQLSSQLPFLFHFTLVCTPFVCNFNRIHLYVMQVGTMLSVDVAQFHSGHIDRQDTKRPLTHWVLLTPHAIWGCNLHWCIIDKIGSISLWWFICIILNKRITLKKQLIFKYSFEIELCLLLMIIFITATINMHAS